MWFWGGFVSLFDAVLGGHDVVLGTISDGLYDGQLAVLGVISDGQGGGNGPLASFTHPIFACVKEGWERRRTSLSSAERGRPLSPFTHPIFGCVLLLRFLGVNNAST